MMSIEHDEHRSMMSGLGGEACDDVLGMRGGHAWGVL